MFSVNLDGKQKKAKVRIHVGAHVYSHKETAALRVRGGVSALAFVSLA